MWQFLAPVAQTACIAAQILVFVSVVLFGGVSTMMVFGDLQRYCCFVDNGRVVTFWRSLEDLCLGSFILGSFTREEGVAGTTTSGLSRFRRVSFPGTRTRRAFFRSVGLAERPVCCLPALLLLPLLFDLFCRAADADRGRAGGRDALRSRPRENSPPRANFGRATTR